MVDFVARISSRPSARADFMVSPDGDALIPNAKLPQGIVRLSARKTCFYGEGRRRQGANSAGAIRVDHSPLEDASLRPGRQAGCWWWNIRANDGRHKTARRISLIDVIEVDAASQR